jgi:N-formylglutamate deformylase
MTPQPLPPWLTVRRGQAPLIISFPHTGTHIPPAIEARLVSARLATRDTDWWIDQLYDFAVDLDATLVRTAVSRTVIDVNRDPSGRSLYPGMATTGLCPTTTFDGEPLYQAAKAPGELEIAGRRRAFFDPYHKALSREIARLRALHGMVVLYDAHSIRSVIPRLFEGVLPNFNIGANDGASCDARLALAVEAACGRTDLSVVSNGRFKGGYTTRHYGRPAAGVHAIQMELACRGYMDEPPSPSPAGLWPPPYDAERATPMRAALTDVLRACLAFAKDC